MAFACVSEIDVNVAESYANKTFLTFDIDWASDEVLGYCIDLVESFGVKATWFATHATPLLERLRANPNFELGIHPNFLPLLNGDFVYGKNYQEVLCYYMDIVPEATAMRAHSLATSSRILQVSKEKGITHKSNLCIPIQATKGAMPLAPFVNWDGLIRCPYHYADDIACMYGTLQSVRDGGAYLMFGLHPIHVFLNTDTLCRYEDARPYFYDYSALKTMRNTGFGARDVLEELVG